MPVASGPLRPLPSARYGETMTDTNTAFSQADKDGNGEIDLLEFRELVAALGLELGVAEAEELFDSIDVDEEGTIDYEEFQDWWTSRER